MQNTLLLDNSYRPIDVIDWKDAVKLLTLDKIEVVETYDKDIRSTYLVIKMPSVVRLVNAFKKRKKREINFSRINVYTRDKWTCQYCNKKCTHKELTFDHVIPKSKGGTTEWSNIVASCGRCNSRKGCKTLKQAGMKLKKDPVKPNWLPSVSMRLSRQTVPKKWKDYLFWHAPF